jgi:hypothetical protein
VPSTRARQPSEHAGYHNHALIIKALLRLHKDPATRKEAERELRRYHDEGLILGTKEEQMARRPPRTPKVPPPVDATVFTGQGIVFAVMDDREKLSAGSSRKGRVSTVDVMAEAIEKALDAGYETSDEIARFLTTHAFHHVPDKRVRFNSVLKAGDAVGAQMLRKLYNGYNDLIRLALDTEDAKVKASIMEEARGYAEALTIVLSPFSVEDPADPRLVNWDEVDRLTASFEKEQRYVIKERQGNPQ